MDTYPLIGDDCDEASSLLALLEQLDGEERESSPTTVGDLVVRELHYHFQLQLYI